MGTRGYMVLKYKDRYFMFYNWLDSYITGLGCELLMAISHALMDGVWCIWKDRMEYIYFLVCQKSILYDAAKDKTSYLYLTPTAIISAICEYMTPMFDDSLPYIPQRHSFIQLPICDIEQRLIDLPFVIEYDPNKYKINQNTKVI